MNNQPGAVTTAAESAAKNSTLLFAYDEDYAREHKTYFQPYYRYIGLFGFILAGCAVWFLSQMFLPKDSALFDKSFFIGAAFWIFGIFIYPKLPSYKFNAWFRCFYYDESGQLWGLRFTPFKDSRSNVRQSMHYENCFHACNDEELIASLIEDMGESTSKGELYRRVRIFAINDIKPVKLGRKARFTYTDQKGKTRKLTVANSYPGLFEFIDKLNADE